MDEYAFAEGMDYSPVLVKTGGRPRTDVLPHGQTGGTVWSQRGLCLNIAGLARNVSPAPS